MKKTLFAVYLGGRAPKCNIELHDVAFVVGTTLQETYPDLVKKWFGLQNRVHIDSYIKLTHVDGHLLELSPIPSSNTKKLYFINFGAYTEYLFGEAHESAFYVAKDKAEALKKARSKLCLGMDQTHLDDSLDVEQELGKFEVDDVIEITQVDQHYIHFIPHEHAETSKAIPGYIKIDLPSFAHS